MTDPTSGQRTYTLRGPDNEPYRSSSPGTLGGQRGGKLYGRLDCPRRASPHWSCVAFVIDPAQREEDSSVRARLRCAHASASWPARRRTFAALGDSRVPALAGAHTLHGLRGANPDGTTWRIDRDWVTPLLP
ncbi:hypothetical protein [Streptomyces sp. NPDC050564]|uniref:hypothetical protein n=1 Tax=Streptomyces sp. NPDC050564 TaxID=3365631 RepID=UPI0037AD3DC3